jgi:hypothetical protein
MSTASGLRARLDFLARVTAKEADLLNFTDGHLFQAELSVERLKVLVKDPWKAESLEAFTGRFGRLQDMIGDKFLPALLDALAEPESSGLENLDKAEKLGLIESANQWLDIRKLRHGVTHEYVEDLDIFCDALNTGHEFVPTLLATTKRLIARWQELAPRLDA